MKQHTSWIIIVALVAVIIGSMIWYSSTPGQYDALAKCAAEKGVKFFGAFWCPHCQEQKTAFGNSARYLPYEECSTPDGSGQLQACTDEKIESYPTWQFPDGSRKSQVLTPEELSGLTGCPLS